MGFHIKRSERMYQTLGIFRDIDCKPAVSQLIDFNFLTQMLAESRTEWTKNYIKHTFGCNILRFKLKLK